MTARLTPEREAVIREGVTSRSRAPLGAYLYEDIRDVLSELDAVRRERDEARKEINPEPVAPIGALLDALDVLLAGKPDAMDISISRTTVKDVRRALTAAMAKDGGE